jgi:hypothetical protein
MSGLLGDGLVTQVLRRGETAARIGQKRLLVAFQGQAPVPATGIDRGNRTAIAVQSVPGHHLAAERDQPQSLDRRIEFRAPVGGHRRQRQTQPGSVGRDHHPRSCALGLVARSAQGLAVDRDHVAVLHQRGNVGEHLAERSIERLGINHPEDIGECVVRWDGVLQPEEVPENMFFCAPKRRHLRAGARPAQYRYEGDHKQLAEVVARVTGARVGDSFEGGQENLHARGSMN